MNRYLIVSNKQWQIDLLKRTLQLQNAEWHFIENITEFTFSNIKKIDPEIIFFTHWSHKITDDIYNKFQCVLFHMTDLPFGRGGSPLQNLIIRGFTKTKISAIQVVKELDAGNIYLKKDLDLNGTAKEIFERATHVISAMIIEIIKSKPVPQPQEGKIEIFKRRKPEDSNLENIEKMESLYDYIRMLDAEGYPNAFIETAHFKFEFNGATLNTDKTVTANVRITKK